MIKLLSVEPFSTRAKNLLIFLFFNWIKMKGTQDLRGKIAEQKPPSPGAPDSGSCAAPGGRCHMCLWCLDSAGWICDFHSWQANYADGSEVDLLQMLQATRFRKRTEGCPSAYRQFYRLALLRHWEPLALDEHTLDSGLLTSVSCFCQRPVSCSH